MNALHTLLEEILGTPIDAANEAVPFDQFADWDSLKHVQLVVGIQSAFQIDFDRDEIQSMKSAIDVAAILAKHGIEA